MVFDLFSKRRKLERGETPDIYAYDNLSNQLRVQITYLFDFVFNSSDHFGRDKERVYKFIAEILREERGVYQLNDARAVRNYYDSIWNYEKEVKNYFLREENAEYALDTVELFFRLTYNVLEKDFSFDNWHANYEEAVRRLNVRFKEHGIGYAFEGERIIRIDSELIHKEIIIPALKLLHDKKFQNAEDEYLKAHEHYKNGRHKECLVDCLKSLETTIKIIGHKRKWNIKETDPASRLIEAVMSNGLIPNYMQAHFSALKACLESGTPTVRNKAGGHGQGVTAVAVPHYLAMYLLGETAVTIRLLVEADKSVP
jgi:hypothetical protein